MSDSEVIVIGGGIAGASVAYHLAEHGRSVTSAGAEGYCVRGVGRQRRRNRCAGLGQCA